MRKYNITCPIRKANPYKRIAKATKEHRVVPNRLNREFKQNTPGKVMLTDITYMPYGNNKIAYLSTIKDSSTNEILAYNLSNSLAIDIVTETINKLVKLESFFGHMKDEIDYKSCRTIEELKILIDDYMDYYNNDRCQWNLKKLTPVQYRNQLLATS